ncbi:MAG: SDR family NAD(P)-dependent oxidoreductase [Mycobacteriales bacterium]
MSQTRVALVTGAGRGIGRSTAICLKEHGATVVGVSRTEADLASLQREAGVEYVVGSVATQEGCEAITSETLARFGQIDILVNNAGIDSGEERPVWDQDPALWSRAFAVNLDGAFHMIRLTSAGMVERGWGRIVAVSSTAGEVGGPRLSAYCASKHGLLGLIRAAAQDVAPHGVTCNAVCPGWVRTPMSDTTTEREAERRGVSTDQIWGERAAESPAGRVVTAEEVAESIAFLTSDAARGINGEALTISLGSVW